MAVRDIRGYLRQDFMPTIWCPGCGNGIVLGAVTRAIDDLGWPRDDTVLISGIGCSARSPSYVDFNSMQTTHGRALAFATGVKTYNPRLHVVCLLGDGDCAAIGGNHLLHAARRNIDLTTVVFNNSVYGMTGGQSSPTTPRHGYSTTAPFGNVEPQLDICAVAAAAGATYVARSTAYHVAGLTAFVKKALQHKGFSLIEAITPCPTGYGRRNKFDSPAAMLRWMRDNSVGPGRASEEKIVIGELVHRDEPEFCDEYAMMAEAARKEIKEPEQEMKVTRSESARAGRYEIRISGSGGQGVIMAGVILAEAAMTSGFEVVQNQSYGPEARGGASRVEVILSDEEIGFPEIASPDLVLCMTEEAWSKYSDRIRAGGIAIGDSGFIKEKPFAPSAYLLPISERTKEATGGYLAANITSLGIITGLSGIVSKEALEMAIRKRIPVRFLEMNLCALNAGYSMIGEISQ